MKQKIKYDFTSLILVVVSLVVLSLGVLFASSFFGQFGDELQKTANDLTEEGANSTYMNSSVDFLANDIENFNDNYFLWFFIAVFIGLILTAIYLEFTPAIMIIIFIFGIIAVLGAYLGTEIYSEAIIDESLASSGDLMTKTGLLMSNPYFPVFIFVGLIVMIVIMYSKKRSGEYQ